MILNIRDRDYSEIIQQIVLKHRNDLLEKTNDLTGFCKYLANQIELDLKQIGIKTYYIDLNPMNIDHVFLIAEFKFENKMKRILIDPTYIQFTKDNTKKKLNLKNGQVR